MASLNFAPSARQGLLDIFDYIARDKPIAAANWIDQIEAKCKLIATAPGCGETTPGMWNRHPERRGGTLCDLLPADER